MLALAWLADPANAVEVSRIDGMDQVADGVEMMDTGDGDQHPTGGNPSS